MTDTSTTSLPAEETESRSKNLRKRLMGVVQIVISIVILIWLINRVGGRVILDTLASVNLWWYGLAFVVFLASIVVRAWRWYVLLTPLGVKLSRWELLRLYLVGFFWNSFLPSGFGGDAYKAIDLARSTGRGAEAATSVLAERIVGLLATSLIGLAVIPFWPGLFPPEAVIVVAGMVAAIIGVYGVVRLDMLRRVENGLRFLRPVTTQKFVVKLNNSLRTYSGRDLLRGLLVSLPFTFLSILDNYLVGVALGVDLGIGYYALYTPIISIVSLLPLSFNGLGVREYSYEVLFGMVGVSPESAIAMALAFNLIRFGGGLLGGVIWALGGVKRIAISD